MKTTQSSLRRLTSAQSRIHISETTQEFSAMIEIPRHAKKGIDVRICDDIVCVWGKNPVSEKSDAGTLDISSTYFMKSLPLPKSVNPKYAEVFVGKSCIYVRARKLPISAS